MEVGVLKMKVGVVSLTVIHQPIPKHPPVLVPLVGLEVVPEQQQLLLLVQEQEQEQLLPPLLPDKVDQAFVPKFMDNVVVIKPTMDQPVVIVDNVSNTMITILNVYHKLPTINFYK